MFKDVFISHAKEDINQAEELYDFLKENEYEPWLDKKKLKVGSNWDYEIKQALKKSTFVILLLSSTAVKKRGYIQKEFKYTLEYAESKLIDDIYIIPILLEKCEVPEQLKRFQWVEMNEVDFKDRILEALNYQREKYISSLPPEQVSLNDFTSLSIDFRTSLKNLEYRCDLPLFHSNPYFDISFVNTFIQQKALEGIDIHRKWAYEVKEFLESNEMHSYFEIQGIVKYISKDFLSISIVYDSFLGGAHPSTSIDTLNFRFNPETKLEFKEVVEYNDLQEFLINSINRFGDPDQKESLVNYCEYITEENINFTFDENKIEIIFINQLPRVIMALGFLSIPIKEIKTNL